MSIRGLLIVAAIAAAITALGIVAIDAPVAEALGASASHGAVARALARVLAVLDRATGMDLPKGVLATGLIVAGGALWRWRRAVGQPLVLIGVAHAISRNGGGQLKPLFGRLRPAEALARGHLHDTFWWQDGIAFPSGHLAHYAALGLAVAYLWPRARVPAAMVVALVIAARLAANAHFVSDIAGSIALAALAVAATGAALARLGPPDPATIRP